MKANVSIILVGILSLTVSCASKNKNEQSEVAHTDQKIEQVTEQKVEAKKEDSKDKEAAYTCLVGKDKRTVTLDRKEKRCEVFYTKFGDQQQVAWAEKTPAICDDVFGKIRTNLEGSGARCVEGNDIQMEKEEVKKPVETAATK